MFLRQNWDGKLTFLLSALNLKISFPLTNKYLLSALHFKVKKNFGFAFLKGILHFSSGEPKLPLIQKVGPSPSTIKLFLRLTA